MELNKILEDLQKYKTTNKEELLTKCIQERLNNSLKIYYQELDNISLLQSKNELRLLKKLNNL